MDVYIHLIHSRFTCMVYMVKKTEYALESILSPEELNGLKPRERSRYVQNLILNVLSKNQDLTLSEIMEKAGLSRVTVSRHLDSLVSSQQVIKKERGMGRIQIGFYKLAGSFAKKEEFRSEKNNSLFFSFFVLDNGDTNSICIQQKEEDEYRNSKVNGAITIPFEDLKSFITYLNTYSARVVNK